MLDFDIDVDLSGLYGAPHRERRRLNGRDPMLIDGAWYQMVKPNLAREPFLQREIERTFELELVYKRWLAAQRERRKAIRAPVMTRVAVDGAPYMLACDVSTHGLRCSGRPSSGLLDVEFKIPGLAFPVDARAEVVDFVDRPVLPAVSLRFIDLDRPYREHIEAYVQRKLTAA